MAVQSMPGLGGGTIGGLASIATIICVIICVALVPFFAFREVGRVFGDAELRAILFTRGAKALPPLSQE
jgi:hypothetical protein